MFLNSLVTKLCIFALANRFLLTFSLTTFIVHGPWSTVELFNESNETNEANGAKYLTAFSTRTHF